MLNLLRQPIYHSTHLGFALSADILVFEISVYFIEIQSFEYHTIWVRIQPKCIFLGQEAVPGLRGTHCRTL